MKQNLNEELARINELMGTKIVNEGAVASPVKNFLLSLIDDAARVGRVFSGDANEIQNAVRALRNASTIEDQFLGAARLAFASDELDALITPYVVNMSKQMTGGSTMLKNIDDYIIAAKSRGMDDASILSNVNRSIDASFPYQGQKDVLKGHYEKQLRGASTPNLGLTIPGTSLTLPTTNLTGAEIVSQLKASYAASPKALKIIKNIETNLSKYTPKSAREAEQILTDNKALIQKAILQTEDPTIWKKVYDYMKGHWATKVSLAFFASIAIFKVVEQINLAMGWTAITPICSMLDALNLESVSCDKLKERYNKRHGGGTEGGGTEGGNDFNIPKEDKGALDNPDGLPIQPKPPGGDN